MLRSLLINL